MPKLLFGLFFYKTTSHKTNPKNPHNLNNLRVHIKTGIKNLQKQPQSSGP